MEEKTNEIFECSLKLCILHEIFVLLNIYMDWNDGPGIHICYQLYHRNVTRLKKIFLRNLFRLVIRNMHEINIWVGRKHDTVRQSNSHLWILWANPCTVSSNLIVLVLGFIMHRLSNDKRGNNNFQILWKYPFRIFFC